jgi:hypothetical protein
MDTRTRFATIILSAKKVLSTVSRIHHAELLESAWITLAIEFLGPALPFAWRMVNVHIEMQRQGWSSMIATWTTRLAPLFVRAVLASMVQTVIFQVYRCIRHMSDIVCTLANRNTLVATF